MKKVVFDTSALLAIEKRETGAEVAEAALANIPYISSVNWCELFTACHRHGYDKNEISARLIKAGMQIIPFTQERAEAAALLYKPTQPFGLSLGDRACLALAQETSRVIITADTAWAALPLDVELKFIR
ncbi:MAG: type II toxin-antitoxin system VapC family toxin [Pseudomonadota bacterium]|nr:type II toxin-antitoxin system VapC family toxin [Pseudomonadota bacterium]MDE3037116.1 type II toxin-antitoxin system VapC family toxin [Pseudomonadota bacterium]